MVKGRQTSEWAQVFALQGAIANLFLDREKRIDTMQFAPTHLQTDDPAPAAGLPDAAVEAEVAANWGFLEKLVVGGKFK